MINSKESSTTFEYLVFTETLAVMQSNEKFRKRKEKKNSLPFFITIITDKNTAFRFDERCTYCDRNFESKYFDDHPFHPSIRRSDIKK